LYLVSIQLGHGKIDTLTITQKSSLLITGINSLHICMANAWLSSPSLLFVPSVAVAHYAMAFLQWFF